MQTLGGNITVQDPYGQLFRIDEKDGGALGEEYAPKEKAAADDGTRTVAVKMTLTAPGCGMGEILVDDVRSKLEMIPTVAEADVELVFDPPWNRNMMSEAARLETGML
jgi:hypothetical protein